MSLLNPIDIIAESAAMDMLMSNDTIDESVTSVFESMVKDIPELYKDLPYTEEVVPVFSDDNGGAVVELESVLKYMQTADIESCSEAVWNLAEYYNIPTSSIAVVIEDEDSLLEAVKEAKLSSKNGKKHKIKAVEKAKDALEDLKDKKIKVFKKPDFNFKKKKKKK